MRKRAIQLFLITAGTVCVALGIIGLFLPLIPTTPFLLLASACYLRGSERMHTWLLSHGKLGAYIRNFEQGNGIPRQAKIFTIATLWLSISLSLFLLDYLWVRIALLLIAGIVTIWLIRMPTLRTSS